MTFNLNFEPITISINVLKMFFIGLFSFSIYQKITNGDIKLKKSQILDVILILITAFVVSYIRYNVGYLTCILCFEFMLSLIVYRQKDNNLGYIIAVMAVSLAINYIIFYIAINIVFLINVFYMIQSDYINLIIMMLIQAIFVYRITKIKRIKNGISYLNEKSQNDYLDIIILNISAIIFFCCIVFAGTEWNSKVSRSLYASFIIFAIIMFITIKKSIQLYYKQRLLIKELDEMKTELVNKNTEIHELEQENLTISKKNHSLIHKQEALEYKLDQIINQKEMVRKLKIKEIMDNIKKELYKAPSINFLIKTEVPEIDDILSLAQKECTENNIDFHFQINGNIHYMINNVILKEELQILIADHIKDAIIAIKNSNNVNKSILVKLGKIEECYGLYIYDSGIEFEKETLDNLGIKPITTHKDQGGTGLGFMNTFDTLRKYKASLLIRQMGKPCKDNFTKVVMFKFDGKNEFKII